MLLSKFLLAFNQNPSTELAFAEPADLFLNEQTPVNVWLLQKASKKKKHSDQAMESNTNTKISISTVFVTLFLELDFITSMNNIQQFKFKLFHAKTQHAGFRAPSLKLALKQFKWKKKKSMVGLLKFYFEDGQELNLNQKNKNSSTTLEH